MGFVLVSVLLLLASVRGAKYCNQCVCLSVRSHVSYRRQYVSLSSPGGGTGAKFVVFDCILCLFQYIGFIVNVWFYFIKLVSSVLSQQINRLVWKDVPVRVEWDVKSLSVSI